VRAACQLDDRLVLAQQRIDIGEVLADRDLVPLALIAFVPLVVVVEDDRDDVVEIVDEPVGNGRVDEPVKAAVESREIVEALLDVIEQHQMFLTQRSNLAP
jgi:hypothetical protein